jgi:hypothetical protein
MQNYIIIKPTRDPAKLSLGLVGDLPEPWQQTARQLLRRRQSHLARHGAVRAGFPNAGIPHNVQNTPRNSF